MRLNYSDLILSNSSAFHHLRFDWKWILPFSALRGRLDPYSGFDWSNLCRWGRRQRRRDRGAEGDEPRRQRRRGVGNREGVCPSPPV